METTRSTELEGGIVNTNSPSPYRQRTSSAVLALKKELIMKAAKEKARIQMDLVEKQLAADIAAVNAKYSPQTLKFNSQYCHDVKKRNGRSQQDLEVHKASETGIRNGFVFPPPDIDGTECPVQLLDSALEGIHTTSKYTSLNDDLRSRIGAHMEVPVLAAERTERLSCYTAADKTVCYCSHNAKVSELTSSTTPVTVMSTTPTLANKNEIKLGRISVTRSSMSDAPKPVENSSWLSIFRLSPHVLTKSPYLDRYDSLRGQIVAAAEVMLEMICQSDAVPTVDSPPRDKMTKHNRPTQMQDLMFVIDPGGARNVLSSGPSPDGVPWERWRSSVKKVRYRSATPVASHP